jgi:hypothetical protein
LFNSSTPSAPASSAAVMPALLPPAKPRFSGRARTATLGNSARTRSIVPSREPLSTIMTRAPPSWAAARLVRHASVSSTPFHASTTIVMRSACRGAPLS